MIINKISMKDIDDFSKGVGYNENFLITYLQILEVVKEA